MSLCAPRTTSSHSSLDALYRYDTEAECEALEQEKAALESRLAIKERKYVQRHNDRRVLTLCTECLKHQKRMLFSPQDQIYKLWDCLMNLNGRCEFAKGLKRSIRLTRISKSQEKLKLEEGLRKQLEETLLRLQLKMSKYNAEL